MATTNEYQAAKKLTTRDEGGWANRTISMLEMQMHAV